MFRDRYNLDARKVDETTKKAVLFRDLLKGDDEEEKKDIQEELTGVPQPSGEELTPVRKLPGTPKGFEGEVEEEYAPMTAEEIEKKRKEQKEMVVPEEPRVEKPRTFRDVILEKLKKETPEGKRKKKGLEKYGPPEVIQNVINTLEPFSKQLADVDIETVKAIIARSELPDILKERANTLFASHSSGDLIRTEQLALNLLGATSRKEVQEAKDWLEGTAEGQQYMDNVSNLYRTRRVMHMLSNTILAMEGEAVIGQPKREPRPSPAQRGEKKRLDELFEALQAGRISNTDFEEAKRKGWTLGELFGEQAKGPKETEKQRITREVREEERRKGHEAGLRLNMKKKADAEGDVTGPGGDAWEYEWTSGPTPTKDVPQKRKHRFPFYNKPSTYTPGEGDQGNLHDVGPKGGQPDMNYLANVIDSMTKTADNDLFESYLLDTKKSWVSYTLFKKAYSKFRPGDIVVQYGTSPAECQTYRRRFGSVAKAEESIYETLEPILARTVGEKA